jgi:DNA polymerase
MAAKFGDRPTQCIFGEDNIKSVVSRIDWSDKLVVGHNLSGFDAMILAWRLGIRPKMWGCTLAMARPIHAKTTGLSLGKLVEHYQLGVKDQTALLNTKGRHLKDFTPAEIAAMEEYNKADVDQCHALFKVLLKQTPADEMRLIDMTIRMLVEPQFVTDTELLTKTLEEERTAKRAMLLDLALRLGEYHDGMDAEEAAQAVATVLGSAQKFVGLLESLGVEAPTKTSPATGKQAPALAKTDAGFIALQENENPLVAAAAQARLGVKSTILESRIEAFLTASKAAGGKLPVPLNYAGADTTRRWSGWGFNPQNLPRIGKKPKRSDALRNCLQAPKGHKVVVADLSGIELRVNMFLWKVPYAMAAFAESATADLYKAYAAQMYGVSVDAVTKDQRQLAKIILLGSGYGVGGAKFKDVAKTMGGLVLSESESNVAVQQYRTEHAEVAAGWKACHNALGVIMAGADGYAVDPWGMCVPCAEGIRTPKGLIRYPKLRQVWNEETKKQEIVYGEGRHRAYIYGAKMVENLVQALSRDVFAEHCLTIKKRTGFSPALLVHDEWVGVVPDAQAEDVLAAVQEVMRTPPAWWPELVTWSEGDIADTYGAAK